MSFLDTKHKRKSATWTSIIGVIILLLIFNFGMRYFDPPKEYGISVNFGTSNVGSGDVQPTEALKPATQETEVDPVEEEVEPVEEEVEEVIEEPIVEEQVATSTPASQAAEEVITQENEEAIAIKKQKEEIRKQEEATKKAAEEREKIEAENRRIEKEKQEKIDAENRRIAKEKQEKIDAENRRIEKERQEKAAKKKKLDALMSGVGNTDGKADGGEGDDNQAGDKGKDTGDPNASGYYGNAGKGGSGGNYELGNRKALDMPKPTYDCNEEGRVFVSISVDTSGNVIAATPGVKGTTNSAACLLQRAKEAALKTKFNTDTNAPAKQVGTIIYNFSLSK
jgi:colicin import membrane protein